MSEITPQQQSMVWKPSDKSLIEGFGQQPILGADYSGDDPIQGLMINSLASAAGFGAILMLGGGVLPLALAGGSGLLLVANDYLLQCKRIKDEGYQKEQVARKEKATAFEVESEPVKETPTAQPIPESPTPIVETPTPIVETPSPIPVVTTSEWDIEEVAEETTIASAPTIPDLVVPLTPEQVKATEFATKFLGDGKVWSADQLAVKHSMSSEQCATALSRLAIMLPDDYLWTADIKVLVKLR